MGRYLHARMPFPDQEQASLLAHQMAAHLEAMEVAAKPAGASIHQATVLTLHLVGLHSKAQAPGLLSLPYKGWPLFGDQAHLQQFLEAAIQPTRQAQLLMDTRPPSVPCGAASMPKAQEAQGVCHGACFGVRPCSQTALLG